MKKLFGGLALGLCAVPVFAQSVLTFDVVFDRVLEASGAFTSNLTAIQPGPLNGNAPIEPPALTGTVTLSTVPSSNQLAGPDNGYPLALNTITLNGSFSTESGFSPSNGWSIHTFTNATFDLYKAGSYFATDFVSNPTDWATFTATGADGRLSDHGPAAIYGGNCPFSLGCQSAKPAGSGSGATSFDLFDVDTPIFASGAPVFGTQYRNSGNHPLVAGSATQTNPGSGLGYDNGMDVFVLQGVLDTANTQGNGTAQLYPDGVNGYPGKVRIVTFSNTGNTAYVVEGHVAYSVVPAPGALLLFASAVGLFGFRQLRQAGATGSVPLSA